MIIKAGWSLRDQPLKSWYYFGIIFILALFSRHKMTHKGWRVVKPQLNQFGFILVTNFWSHDINLVLF